MKIKVIGFLNDNPAVARSGFFASCKRATGKQSRQGIKRGKMKWFSR